MFDYETLKIIWWLLVGVLLVGFAVMDGHDMGVGTLLPFLGRTDVERRVIINTVGPHWDGNQVWFITGGGAIFAAWPLVYATAFSGFYWAMLAVLWALFFRPVGFDYRSKINDARWRSTWDWGLFVGGAVPPLIFGVAFGNLLQGVPFHFDENLVSYYTGSFWALLNPFALLCGVVSTAMITFHGAIYLAHRTESDIQRTGDDRGDTFRNAAGRVFFGRRSLAGFGHRRLCHHLRHRWWRHGQPTGEDGRQDCRRMAGQLFPRAADHGPAARGLSWRDRRHPAGAPPAHPRRLCRLGAQSHRGNWHGRRFDVPFHHAIFNTPGRQPHRLGQRVEPPHAVDHVLGDADLHADHHFLHELGVPGDVRQGHERIHQAERTFGVLIVEE